MGEPQGAPGAFEFGLSDQEEARAARLHRDSVIFDLQARYGGSEIFSKYPPELLVDFEARISAVSSSAEILAEAIYWPFEMSLQGKSHLIRDWLVESGITCGTYEFILHAPLDARDALSWAWEEKLERYVELPWLRVATTAGDIRQAKADGAVALYVNCQPIIPVPRELGLLDVAHSKGLRSLMLTYNRMDHTGVGCTERVDAGLSAHGLAVVERCNDLGIVVDVSHCGHLTTLDACRISRHPVTANHTLARTVYDHARAKTDDALKAIAETNGLIGVLAVPYFLSSESAPTIECMLDHIDYIANLVGWQHVAIGTDYPWPIPNKLLAQSAGAEFDAKAGFRPEDRVDRTKRLIGYEDCRDLPNITRGLVKRGYGDDQIRGILGENALRVFETVIG
jgi:membrane dipeptidase